jgi:phage repressor protein C with HTH and peptisase S24 domain
MVENEALREDQAKRLKEAIAAAGQPQRGALTRLAAATGVSLPAASKWLKGEASPSPGHLMAIAAWLHVRREWLQYGEGEMKSDQEASNVEPGPPIISPYRAIPIVGTAQMGSEGYWHALDEAEGYVDIPSRDPSAYALRLKGDSMAPAIRSGWIAVCEPGSRLVPGEYVMIRLVDGESMLKELLFANDVEVSVMSINDAYGRRTIPVEQIEAMHYVGAIVPPGKVRI